MKESYPERYERLKTDMGDMSRQLPATMDAFSKLHQAAIADGALSSKAKELIALAIAIAVRCDGCIAYHVHDALEAGASREEVLQTIGVAVLMGGGPSVVYGSEAATAVSQFVTERAAM